MFCAFSLNVFPIGVLDLIAECSVRKETEEQASKLTWSDELLEDRLSPVYPSILEVL
jgi:hypothetical protein